MKIQQSSQFRFSTTSRNFYPAKHPEIALVNPPTSYIYSFLLEAYGRTLREGILEYITDIFKSKSNMVYNRFTITADSQHDLIYLIENSSNYDDKINTPELNQIADECDLVELCRRGIADHAVLTKENFLYLLLKWEKIVEKDSPYLLIYLDDKNWYDSEPFDSLQAMEEFIDQHTDKSIRYCDTAPQAKKSHDKLIQQSYTSIIIIVVILLTLLIKLLNTTS